METPIATHFFNDIRALRPSNASAPDGSNPPKAARQP
jgi:hypothetical protein